MSTFPSSVDLKSFFDNAGGAPASDRPARDSISAGESSGDVMDVIKSAAERNGVPPELAFKIAGVESSFKPGIKNQTGSSAGGLFQIIDSTWKGMGGSANGKYDPEENADVGTRLISQNIDALKRDLKRNPSYGEVYAAHMFGSGVSKMLASADRNQPIEQGLSLFENQGRVQTILDQNPNLRGKTVGQVLADLNRKVGMGVAQGPAPDKSAAGGKYYEPRQAGKYVDINERKGATAMDVAKEFFASATEGVGSIGQFAGEGAAAVANAVTGTEDYEGKNVLKPVSEGIRNTMTEGGKQARESSNIEGSVLDLFKGEAKLPDNVDGWLMMGANGFGSLLTSVIPIAGPAGRVASLTKAARAAELAGDVAKATELTKAAEAAARSSRVIGAGSGAAMTGGAAADDVRDSSAKAIASMSHEQLLANVPVYSEVFAQTGDERQARNAVVNTAARWAAGLSSVAGAAGGALNAKVIEDFLAKKGMSTMLGDSMASRTGRAAVGGAAGTFAEGGQETSEKVGQNVGENIGLGRDPGADAFRNTAGDFVGGAMVGGPIGTGGGFISKPSQPVVPPHLQPVVEHSQKPGSVLSRAAVAGNQGVLAQAAATQTAPVEQPADIAAPIAVNESAAPVERAPAADATVERVRAIEDGMRTNDWLDTLRDDGVDTRELLQDLAQARDTRVPQAARDSALERVETAISWATQNAQPRAPMDSIQNNPAFNQPKTGRTVETPQVPNLDAISTALSEPALRSKISDTDRDELLYQNNLARNPDAPQTVRVGAARLAMEIVGRYQAGNTQGSAAQTAPALLSPAVQQNVASETSPASDLQYMDEVPAPKVSTPAGEGTALLRKRAAVVQQLAENGFETVQRDGKDFYMVNSKTGQKFKLDGPADAQLARKAMNDRVDALANTAAASPLNDLKEPTKAQIEAGNYKKSDVIDLNGMQIKIENPKNSVRRGVSPDGEVWETKMAHHYGEFQGTVGADGDKLDVFVGPRTDSNKVYVIDQVNEDGSFDEHKVMMGFTSEDAARQGYLANYSKGWTGLGAITEMSPEEFKSWAKSRAAKKPLAKLPEKPAPVSDQPAAMPADVALEAEDKQTGPIGQFATYEEARAYISKQRQANGNVSGLPLRLNDGSFTIASKNSPQYAEAKQQQDERDGKQTERQSEQGEFFYVKDGEKNKKLKRVKKGELPKKTSARRPGDPRPISQDEATLIEQVASILGKNVVFYEAQDGRLSDGFFDPAQPNTLFVATETTVNPLAVFGHEFFHGLRESNPEAWNAIAAVVRERVTDPKGFREDYYGEETASQKGDAALSEQKGGELEELVSDLGGNLMMDASFWREVFAKIAEDNGDQAKGIVARLAASLEQFIARVMGAIKQRGYDAESFVGDVASVRNAYKDGLAEYIKAAGISKIAMGAEITKAGQQVKKSTDRAAKPNDGLTVEGYHFSKQERPTLSTGMYGTGLKGSARDEIMNADDKRLKERLSFYVNKGTGIRPEAGVGSIAHKATLTNIYDADADALRLRSGNARDFESKVLDAGYSGYLQRMEGTQPGQVILLGKQTIKPEVLGSRNSIDNAKPVPGAVEREADLADQIASDKSLPAGALSLARWSEVLLAKPEVHAQLQEAGAFDGEGSFYKGELANRVREMASQIRKSADRGRKEYADVEAKYKGTDQWLKAPNGEATKLTERQWVQVRTPSFKKWFGDWEQAAADGGVWATDLDVSKVVDANGEPMVVYHGSEKGGFTEFKQPGFAGRGDLGIWTTDDYSMARSYVRKGRAGQVALAEKPTDLNGLEDDGYTFYQNDDGETELTDPNGYFQGAFATVDKAVEYALENYEGADLSGTQPGVYALFANIRSPNEEDFQGALWTGDVEDKVEVVDENGDNVYNKNSDKFFDQDEAEALVEANPGYEITSAYGVGMTTDDVVREALREKLDGSIIRRVIDDGGGPGYYLDPADIFVAFDPSQLKSADYNNGEFNDSTDDLRLSADRKPKKAKQPKPEAAIGDKTDVSKLPVGRVVPTSAGIGSLESSLALARSKSYNRGRELKVDIQDRVLEAAKDARVNLNAHNQENHKFLASLVVEDAKYALKSNENAIGWYDSKISRALGAIAMVHPEINDDPKARLAFMWALAVTSNGLKVNKNFELAEKAYRDWKRTGSLPADAGIGNAAGAINKGLDLYNALGEKIGFERLSKFMATEFTVGEIDRMLGQSVGGEWKSTPVRGAAILGPKIGNGFFSNLNGFFDALTMDRWLMRTYGRLTGTLLGVTKEDVTKSRDKLSATIESLTNEERQTLGKTIGVRINKNLTKAALDSIATAAQKASMKKDKRALMSSTPAMNEFRKNANNHHMTMDGQKEAPSGPSERNWIRAIFGTALEQLRADGKDMTMSDLQALLWYPERRLYDAAKSEEDMAEGYEDDEAPDYANAALDLAVKVGFDRARVIKAMDAAEARGTIKGTSLTADEKAAMMSEFRAAPKQAFQLAYEVAPDPADEALVQAWGNLTTEQRRNITDLVKDSVLNGIVDLTGAEVGKTAGAVGGFAGLVNPNLITAFQKTKLSLGDARGLAAAIGFVLDQDSVALVDERAKDTVGLVRITFSGKVDKHVDAIFEAINGAVPEIDAFTARGNNFDMLNFTGMSNEALYGKIEAALAGLDIPLEGVISYGDTQSELVEKANYEDHIQGLRPQSGQDIRAGLEQLRARAREIVAEEIRNAGRPGPTTPAGGPGRGRGKPGEQPQAGEVKLSADRAKSIPEGLEQAGFTRIARDDARRFKNFGTWERDGVRVALSSSVLAVERGEVMKYTADDGEMTLEGLLVDQGQRGAGKARDALNVVTGLADQLGRTLYAEPVQLEKAKGLTRGQLVSFYQRAGFEPIDASSKVMVRQPQVTDAIRMSADRVTRTAEFKRWFGDSKVVDSDGNPLVVYHGTGHDVSVFQGRPDERTVARKMLNKMGMGYDEKFYFSAAERTAGSKALEVGATWFTSDPALASDYASAGRRGGSQPNVVPVYLSMSKPVVLDSRSKTLTMPDGTVKDYGLLFDDTNPLARTWGVMNIVALNIARTSGGDGVILRGVNDVPFAESAQSDADTFIVFKPTQIKSAIGNNGEFDASNPDIRMSADRRPWFDDLSKLKVSTNYQLGDLLKSSKKLSWWDRTIGTQYNLAQKHPQFKRVFDAVQQFINDVSAYATRAADMAPNILPKLETLRDITKSPLAAADVKALRDPIFGGTLKYARDEQGQIYEEDDVSKAGVVFTDQELRDMFSLDDKQIGLYREFRSAVDQSLTDLAISDMLRYLGKDAEDVKEEVMAAGNVDFAVAIITRHLNELGTATRERAAVMTNSIEAIEKKAEQANSLMDRGYAPLSRFGQYTVYVVGPNGEQEYFSMFESQADANVMARKMEEQYPEATVTTGTMSQESYKLFSGVTPETLALFGESLGLEESGVDAKSEAYQQMLKVAKTNRSAMKRLIQRKGIDGYSEDAGRVLAGFVYSNARQVATNLHAGEISQSVQAVSDGDVKDAAIRLMEYIQNPQEEAQALRGLMFTQFIGGSIASALVNMTQPFTMTLPYLAQFAGVTGAGKLMGDAVKLASRGIRNDDELRVALKRAEDEGVVSPQEVHQLMAQAQGRGALQSGDGTKMGDAAAKVNNTLAKLGLGWGKLFSAAEQFNRRVTFIAAYKMAREQGIENPFEFAQKAIAETQGVYNKGNKPAWARGAVGGTLFTFKQYSIGYVEFLRRMWGNGPEGKKAVGLALGVLFLMSGMGGMPGADDLDDVIDGFAQRVLGKSFDSKQAKKEFFASILGQAGAEFVMSGVSGLPGMPIDVAGRMGLGNLIPGTGLFTKKRDYGQDYKEIVGPAGTLFTNAGLALASVAQGNVVEAGKALSPVAAQNWIKTADMVNMGYYRDQKGRKVVDTDGYDAFAKFLGFQPRAVAQVQEATSAQQNLISQNKLRETEIADKWAAGRIEKNPAKVEEAKQMLADWNEKNPQSKITIDPSQINKRVIEANKTKAQRIAATAPKEIRGSVKKELESALRD